MSYDYDICVIGSGAGGAPVALRAAQAGYSVIVLEKGPWLDEKDFVKDEIAMCRREYFTPDRKLEPHVVERKNNDGSWYSKPTNQTGWDFWNGSMVGGATNLMSGFFQRLKPEDFQLRTKFGEIQGANIQDWPISYQDLEPYYTLVEKEVGISGKVIQHPNAEPRSTNDFPYPPTAEHPLAKWIDKAGAELGLHPLPLPRAVLPYSVGDRYGCSYSGFCGSYGCATGAKGSARAALLKRAVKTGNCKVMPKSMARKIETNSSGDATAVLYHSPEGKVSRITAQIFVIACQPIETSRLLFLSSSDKHPNGLANSSGMLGKYLIYSAGSSIEGSLTISKYSSQKQKELRSGETFINRCFQDWYFLKNTAGKKIAKGGSMDVIPTHPNPISAAAYFAFNQENLRWGAPLKRAIEHYFRNQKHLMIETFCDWMPVEDSFVSLDSSVKDQWGLPVAKVRIGKHKKNEEVGNFLAQKAKMILKHLGAEDFYETSSGSPSTNLVAGTCRFGNDPKISVLNPDCKAHDLDNLYVTDGSFMPTGGSVPYTWTIYANSFRVADKIIKQLGGNKSITQTA